MRKNGFTLAELLVTVGVIGIVAAITVPIVGNISPDKNKVKVLKSYKAISDVTSDMLSDPGLYMQIIPDGGQVECVGLGCTEIPANPAYQYDKTATGVTKYGWLLGTKMNAVKGPETNGNTISFVTPDGVAWRIKNNPNTANYTVEIGTNGEDSFNNSCSYNSSSCNENHKPEIFIFNVNEKGVVTPGDPLSQAYIRNPYKLNDKKADFRTAKKNCDDNKKR